MHWPQFCATSDPVSTRMGDCGVTCKPIRYVTSQLGQLSLLSLRGRWIEYQPARVADNTVRSHWQVASRSSEVNFTKNCMLLYLFFYLLCVKDVCMFIDFLLRLLNAVPSYIYKYTVAWIYKRWFKQLFDFNSLTAGFDNNKWQLWG